ncbi:MAG: hypothetical protein QXK88_09110 [Desulfurococcaceae archaeon]
MGHAPLVEHRALTGKLLRRWCSELKNSPNSIASDLKRTLAHWFGEVLKRSSEVMESENLYGGNYS